MIPVALKFQSLPDPPLGEGQWGEVLCVSDQHHVHAPASGVVPVHSENNWRKAYISSKASTASEYNWF